MKSKSVITQDGQGLGAPPCSEIPVVLAKELWTQRVHVGGRRYQLMLKIGHQSFSVGDVGTAKTIGWHQSQLAIALARMVNSECVASTMIERLSHFPNAKTEGPPTETSTEENQ